MNKSKTAAQPPAQKGSQKVPTGPTSWKDRISEQDYEELKATFDLFDEDGGGTIDPVEV
jgi:Ca2+-binding EF-hand superfamily protein